MRGRAWVRSGSPFGNSKARIPSSETPEAIAQWFQQTVILESGYRGFRRPVGGARVAESLGDRLSRGGAIVLVFVEYARLVQSDVESKSGIVRALVFGFCHVVDWDEANVRHVARHSGLPDEAEHVILNDPVDLGLKSSKGGAPPQPRGNSEGPRSSRGDHMARRSCTSRNGVRANQTAHSVLLPGKREVIHKMAKKQPHFETETQKAEWWAKNQDLILNRFQQAKALGKLGKGTVAPVAGRTRQTGRSITNDHHPASGR